MPFNNWSRSPTSSPSWLPLAGRPPPASLAHLAAHIACVGNAIAQRNVSKHPVLLRTSLIALFCTQRLVLLHLLWICTLELRRETIIKILLRSQLIALTASPVWRCICTHTQRSKSRLSPLADLDRVLKHGARISIWVASSVDVPAIE